MIHRGRNAPFFAMFTTRNVLDDRGRRVVPVRWSRWACPFGGHVVSPELRQRARQNVSASAGRRYNGWGRLLLMMVVTLVGNVCVLVPLWALYVRFLMPQFIPSLASGAALAPGRGPSLGWGIGMTVGWMVTVGFTTTLASIPMARWYWNPVIVEAVVREGHCGACGYPLPTAAAEHDGCTVCPECGAAWRVPPTAPPSTGGKPPVPPDAGPSGVRPH
jgi:hypothetical protein